MLLLHLPVKFNPLRIGFRQYILFLLAVIMGYYVFIINDLMSLFGVYRDFDDTQIHE